MRIVPSHLSNVTLFLYCLFKNSLGLFLDKMGKLSDWEIGGQAFWNLLETYSFFNYALVYS